MDLATLVGLLGAFGIIIAAIITGGSAIIFVNVPSLFIVVGGTIFAVLMKFPLGHFFTAFKVAMKAFFNKAEDPRKLIQEGIELANIASVMASFVPEPIEKCAVCAASPTSCAPTSWPSSAWGPGRPEPRTPRGCGGSPAGSSPGTR